MKKILIIDDNPLVRTTLRNQLEGASADWKVCGEAENGRVGIDKALELHPDLVILDLSMPVMNGFEAANCLKRLMPAVPLVLFTTFSSPVVEKEAVTQGISLVKSKSDSLDDLMKGIRSLLAEKHPSGIRPLPLQNT